MPLCLVQEASRRLQNGIHVHNNIQEKFFESEKEAISFTKMLQHIERSGEMLAIYLFSYVFTAVPRLMKYIEGSGAVKWKHFCSALSLICKHGFFSNYGLVPFGLPNISRNNRCSEEAKAQFVGFK